MTQLLTAYARLEHLRDGYVGPFEVQDVDDILVIIHEARKHIAMQGCPETCTLRVALKQAGVPKR